MRWRVRAAHSSFGRGWSRSAVSTLDWDGSDPDRPVAIVEVECSAGTYIRASPAISARPSATPRTSGRWSGPRADPSAIEDAISLDALREAAGANPASEGAEPDTGAVAALLLPLDAGLEALPALTLDAADLPRVARGQAVRTTKSDPVGRPDPDV